MLNADMEPARLLAVSYGNYNFRYTMAIKELPCSLHGNALFKLAIVLFVSIVYVDDDVIFSALQRVIVMCDA